MIHGPLATPRYEVSAEPLSDPELLQKLWCNLEERSHCSFFLSWRWIGTWLEFCAQDNVIVVSVREAERLAALAIFVRRRSWGGLGPRHLRLHESGDPVLDSLTIEFNGMLAEPGHEADTLAAVIEHLHAHDRKWSTLYLPGLERWGESSRKLEAAGQFVVRTRPRPTHFVNLEELRNQNRAYPDGALSANTRGALRRTERKLTERFGPVSAVAAENIEQRLAFFRELARLHSAAWRDREGHSGAFGHQVLLDFHEKLISAPNAADIELLRFTAGPKVLGYAYNFIWRGISYFYQSGFDYAACRDCGSPGLLMLSKAVQWSYAAGRSCFDFMAGDSQYKRQLRTHEGELTWVAIDRDTFGTRLRTWRRSIRVPAH